MADKRCLQMSHCKRTTFYDEDQLVSEDSSVVHRFSDFHSPVTSKLGRLCKGLDTSSKMLRVDLRVN